MSEVTLRLASAFVALCEAGDVSYLAWKTEIRCNIDEWKEHGNNLSKAYTDEVTKLEQRRVEWEKSLLDFRLKHHVLNYFSVKQILFLQKHIFPLGQNEINFQSLPAQVYTLLKFVDPEINNEKIKDAHFLATTLDCTDRKEDWTILESVFPNFAKFSVENLIEFVETLQDDHLIEENIAMASLIAVSPFVESSAVLWCEKQDSDNPVIQKQSAKAIKELNTLKSDAQWYVYCFLLQIINLFNSEEVIILIKVSFILLLLCSALFKDLNLSFSVSPAQDSCMSVDGDASFMALDQFSLFLVELQQLSEYF